MGAFFYIHGSLRASYAEILYFGSKVNIFLIKDLASSDILDQSSGSNLNFPYFTFFNISSSLFPPKGGYPHSKIYNITPHDHTSHFSS